MTSKWNKFRLLMWKNFKIQWRHPIQTVLEIAIPVLFSALLVLIRSLVTPDIFPNPMTFPSLPLSDISQALEIPARRVAMKMISFKSLNTSAIRNFSNEIVYSPENKELEIMMSIVRKAVTPLLKVYSVRSSAELAPRLAQHNSYVGIEFPDSYANITQLPDHISYSLRYPGELRRTGGAMNPLWFNWRTDFLFPMFQPGGARNWGVDHDGSPAGYYVEAFLFIQQFIFKAFSEMKNYAQMNLTEIPQIHIRKFPYPPFVFDVLLQGLQTLVSLFILLSFVYPCINIIKYITIEKENQLKEAMKIMGLESGLHWLAWFLKCFIYMFITVTLMVILLKTRWYGADNPNSVFTYSSGTALWMFLLVYSITTITFCFMISVFFSKANTASAIAGLIWFLTYTPYTFIQQRYDTISLVTKLSLSLFSNTAMALGFNVVIRYEGTQEGLQWHNIFTPVTIDDDFHLGHVLIMLIFDAFLYLMIALYVEKKFPGDYGVL